MNIELVVLIVGVICLAGGIYKLHLDELSGWGVILVFIAGGTLLFFGITAGARRGCRVFGEANGFDQRYTVATGCLVELEPGLWLDPELIRYSDGQLLIETEPR